VSEELECLDHRQGGCRGPVEMRYPLSATGRGFPRCELHWVKRLDEQDRINQYYPDSQIAPSWFDPANAGESWDEDY
jgi:hypothetical protein